MCCSERKTTTRCRPAAIRTFLQGLACSKGKNLYRLIQTTNGIMGTGQCFWAVFCFACICSASLANNAKINFREKEKKVLDQILGTNKYDARIRPSGVNGTDGPAVVYVNIFVRSISKIDDVTMEYSVQLTFREQWTDERLKFDDIGGRLKYLTLTEASRVWMPDLFFSNEKEGHFHNIIMPNVYIRIFPKGSVLYSIRISLTLACPMNLKLYPLDRQVCSLRMASYGWTTDDLVFQWKEGDPVQVVKNLHLPRFTLEKFLTDYCNSKTNTGEYSCLKVDLLFKREFSYYLIQIYIPCCMLVIVSWVSFWLDQGAVPARVSLGVTTLLTMATQTSGINASLPPVSYTKAIDVWTGVCLTFVFGALLEFALVNYASRSDRAADMHRENMKKKRRELEQASLDAASDLLDTDSNATIPMVNSHMKPLVRHPGDPLALEKLRQCEVHLRPTKRPHCCKTWLAKFPTSQCSRSKRIDVISRITFPLVFALFNLVYWSTYLFREEEDE
ncbi:glutamate-gated chloride channel isoform X7 [Hermetia illucens]|uniref:glutamate-gated chloride channel isoform X7 n=1 Tax=Hermetia illucens TaxID=343691 RepID=UPI0018CC0A75|nr:glutamate-gated chloride channel isoform X7 [Hermetia illucens]